MKATTPDPTVLLVPGLRDHVEEHWQTWLLGQLPKARMVPPMGRTDLDCVARVEAIEREAQAIEGPIVVVAHSGGVVMVAHWLQHTQRAVASALLVTPPDFEQPLPAGYPTQDELQAGNWLPLPRAPLPCPAIVAASRDDPLAHYERVAQMAWDWRATLLDLGNVGHVNPASGFGPWPDARRWVAAAMNLAR